MLIATDNTLDALLAGLDANPDEWFAYLAVLQDFYLERDDHEAADACKWLRENGKRPVSNPKRSWFAWFDYSFREEFLGPYVNRENIIDIKIRRAIDRKNGSISLSTRLISRQLIPLIELWKEGLRP